MYEELFEDPALLSTAIYQSQAYITYLRLHHLGLNFYVFARNYDVLTEYITRAQHPDSFMDLWVVGKEEQMERVLREIMRRLHNFIASAKTYVDHTRAVINDWYGDTEFLKEYEKEIKKRFTGNHLTGFIEDLRNYLLHYRLPIMTARVTFPTDPKSNEQKPNQAFIIKKTELLKWNYWKRNKGKPYLEQADDVINLLLLVRQYYEEILDFNEWLINRLEAIHADELKWVNEMESKIEGSLDKLYKDNPLNGEQND